MALGCPANMRKPIDGSADQHQQGRANGQLLPTKHMQSLGKFCAHGALIRSWIPAAIASSLR
jgi:hypothetical protein